ncbi:unnamed protein product [marine sediment metagenome]|uniref:Thiamine biosynthesis protein ThiS n=1 Tax=marine sediment metagenome TaxID=412755 RepID=X0X805_9ZZZZ
MQIVVNGAARTVAAGQTVAELVTALQLEPRHVAVELNREVLPRSAYADQVLAEGDAIELVTLVGGG